MAKKKPHVSHEHDGYYIVGLYYASDHIERQLSFGQLLARYETRLERDSRRAIGIAKRHASLVERKVPSSTQGISLWLVHINGEYNTARPIGSVPSALINGPVFGALKRPRSVK